MLALDGWVRSIEAMLEVIEALCEWENENGPWLHYAIGGVLVSPVAALFWFYLYRGLSPYWTSLWVVLWFAILFSLLALGLYSN